MDKVKIIHLDEETEEELRNAFPLWGNGFVRAGDAGYLMRRIYAASAPAVRNLRVRPDDVWVTGFARSGTTMTEELVWLLNNDLDFAGAAARPLAERYHYLPKNMLEYNIRVEQAPSPRFLKSHLPLSLLPRALLATARVVYVARDPRDVAVSFYHLHKMLKGGFTGNLKQFWELFQKDQVKHTPYFENILESWNERNHPNMMFIFYEELNKDLRGTIRRMANFFRKSFTEVEIDRLCEHMAFDTFKNNPAVVPTLLRPGSELLHSHAPPFVRRGKMNAWREYFDEEMTAQAERWVEERLRSTTLRFPC